MDDYERDISGREAEIIIRDGKGGSSAIFKPHAQVEKPIPKWVEDELFDGDPDCEHDLQRVSSSAVKCQRCPGWFPY